MRKPTQLTLVTKLERLLAEIPALEEVLHAKRRLADAYQAVIADIESHGLELEEAPIVIVGSWPESGDTLDKAREDAIRVGVPSEYDPVTMLSDQRGSAQQGLCRVRSREKP